MRARSVGGVLAHAGGEDHGVHAAHGGGVGSRCSLRDLVRRTHRWPAGRARCPRQRRPPGHGSRRRRRRCPARRTPCSGRSSTRLVRCCPAGPRCTPRWPASMSPARVPMGRPARGVKPMEVSTHLPTVNGSRWRNRCPGGRMTMLQLLNGPAQHGGGPLGDDIAMGGAVEAVAADLVILGSTSGRAWRRCKPWRAWSGGRRCRTQPPWGCRA